MQLPTLERWKRTRLLFDERLTQFIYPHIRMRKLTDGMILVSGTGLGGTTTICTANAVRMDHDLSALGINLDPEFDEIYREIPISTAHQSGWHETTRRLFEVFRDMNLDPQPMPKMGDYEHCVHCGRCIFGCPMGVKWDSRRYLQDALDHGATVMTGCKVERVLINDSHAIGVQARRGWSTEFLPADLVVLAAGGLGTPVILQNSGITCESNLFVDPVLTVAGRSENCRQCYEVEMPFVAQREHFILSPYFDYVSFIYNRDWSYRAVDTVGIMIKLADTSNGQVSSEGIEKALTAVDHSRLNEGVDLCLEILRRFEVDEGSAVLGTINAGHPGGTLPLTQREATTFHHERLPGNVYVADASLIPAALGNPPILTIIALAKRVSRHCIETFNA